MSPNVHMHFGELDACAPEPASFVATAADDEDDAPAPATDPVFEAVRIWREIDRRLPTLTAAQRRSVLDFIDNIEVFT